MNNRAMKDSSIEWMGGIPENWEVLRTKNHFSVVKRIVGEEVDSFERLALTMNGVVKRSKTDNSGLQPEKFENYQILKPNELVFKLIDLANVKTSRVGISDYEGLVSPAYIVLTNDIEDNRYSYYFFMNMYYQEIFNKMADDGVRSSLSRNDLLNFPFLLPPLHEQQAIATYLDDKVSRLDQLIADQQRVIEEWKAYKQSLITETVTKGLNPEVELKESGIEWIGEIPSHWEVKRLKFVSNCLDGKRVPISSEKRKKGNVPYWGAGSVTDYVSDYLFNEELLLLGEDGAPFNDAFRDVAFYVNEPIWANNHIHVLKIKTDYSPKFIKHSLNCVDYNRFIGGSILPKLTQSKMNQIELPIPPLHEQQQIADFLDEKCSKIDQLIEDKQRLIEDLKAYKQSLIYECVTGKKEIV